MTGIGTAGATLIDDHTAHLMDEPPGVEWSGGREWPSSASYRLDK